MLGVGDGALDQAHGGGVWGGVVGTELDGLRLQGLIIFRVMQLVARCGQINL